MNALQQAVKSVGGPQRAAQICGVSVRYIHKIMAKGALPRTEYSGETRYAELLAECAGEFKFTAQWLLSNSRPKAA